MLTRRIVFLAGSACLALSAHAQQYPSRPITVVINNAPGGSIEAAARIIGEAASARLGTPLVTEFRPGAGGNIGTGAVVKAPPDGYTVLFSSNGIGLEQAIRLNPAFDPLKDLRPITPGAFGYIGVLINPSKIPANTLAEFIAYAKARPGKLNFAHPGVGSYSHLASEIFLRAAGIEAVSVPYKGGFPTIAATVAGETEILINDGAVTRPMWQAGKLKLLAMASPVRVSYAPNTPLVSETIPGLELGYWYGYFAPAGTPNAVFGRLESEFTGALRDAQVKEKLAGIGLEAGGMSSEQFRKKLETEIAQWKALIPKIGIQPE